MTVAVIDTGVDYDHPDLKSAFEKYKGWDFVDDDKDPQETPAGDPKGEATTHGTHVAGTIAADGKIKGVALMPITCLSCIRPRRNGYNGRRDRRY